MLHLEDVLRGQVRVQDGEAMNIAMMAGGRSFRMEITIEEGVECGLAEMSTSTMDSAMEYNQMTASRTDCRTYSSCSAGSGYGRHKRSRARAFCHSSPGWPGWTSRLGLSWCRRTMSDGAER